MGWNRVIQKLRHEGPWRGGQRILYRQLNKIKNRWRRRRWQRPDTAVSVGAVPPGFSHEPAARLWPGAADRSWIHNAKERWPELHARASLQAVNAAQGRFDLLGSGPVSLLDQDGRIRWHDDFKAGVSFPHDCLYLDVPIWLEKEGADIKVPWELSRFQHVFPFLWTDPQRYGDVFVRQWCDWTDANPVGRGVNWACTMDVALRAISWTAALAAWGDALGKTTLQSMAAALATHGHFIRDNLEWVIGARTNHYFSDIVGLAVLGAVMQPYSPAEEWSRFAARELRREITEQFAPDGLNKECSTAYHRFVLELATLGTAACRVAGMDLGVACGQRMLEAYRAVDAFTDASGRGPLIGDNDSGRVMPMAAREDANAGYLLPVGAAILGASELAVGPAPPELALLCGPGALGSYEPRAGVKRIGSGRRLSQSGLFVLGDDRDRMVIRCGPSAYAVVGWHRHLDQLSITVTVGQQPLIVDSGQYCYTPYPARRNRYRSTAAHNTVEVDGESQCRVFTGDRAMYSIVDEAKPRCDRFDVDEEGGRFIGRHGGYRRLRGGGDHERSIEFDPATRHWTVLDRLALRGEHCCVWRFHLHPKARAESRDGAWLVACGRARLTLRWIGPSPPRGSLEPSVYAPAYGIEVPSHVLVFMTSRTGPVEARFELHAWLEGDR